MLLHNHCLLTLYVFHYYIKHYYITLLLSLEFFPFGIGNGDTVGPRAVDESSEAIHLDVPIIFYQKAETDLYVSLITNGLI